RGRQRRHLQGHHRLTGGATGWCLLCAQLRLSHSTCEREDETTRKQDRAKHCHCLNLRGCFRSDLEYRVLIVMLVRLIRQRTTEEPWRRYIGVGNFLSPCPGHFPESLPYQGLSGSVGGRLLDVIDDEHIDCASVFH